MGVRVIRGDKGMGDIPGILGDLGGLQVLCNRAQLIQELRLRV